MVAKRRDCGVQSMLYAIEKGYLTYKEICQPDVPKRKSSYNLLMISQLIPRGNVSSLLSKLANSRYIRIHYRGDWAKYITELSLVHAQANEKVSQLEDNIQKLKEENRKAASLSKPGGERDFSGDVASAALKAAFARYIHLCCSHSWYQSDIYSAVTGLNSITFLCAGESQLLRMNWQKHVRNWKQTRETRLSRAS